MIRCMFSGRLQPAGKAQGGTDGKQDNNKVTEEKRGSLTREAFLAFPPSFGSFTRKNMVFPGRLNKGEWTRG